MKKPKILFLLFTPRYSGAEICLTNFLMHSSHIEFIIGCGMDILFPKKLSKQVRHCECIRALKRPNNALSVIQLLKNTACYFYEVQKIINEENISIVFINNYQLAFYSLPLALYYRFKKKHIKFIWYDHNFILLNIPFGKSLEKLFNRFFDKTVVLSQVFLDKYKLKEKIVILPNSIDCETFFFNPILRRKIRNNLGVDNDTLVIGLFGQISERKDTSKIIGMVNSINSQKKIHFLIIGKKNFLYMNSEHEFDHIVSKYEQQISILGWTSDISGFYSAIDIYINLSEIKYGGEAMPTVILEAMACSRVVVANNIGAIGDIIIDGHDGILINDKFNGQTKDRLNWVFNNYDDLENIRVNARHKVLTKYNLKKNIELFESIFC